MTCSAKLKFRQNLITRVMIIAFHVVSKMVEQRVEDEVQELNSQLQ